MSFVQLLLSYLLISAGFSAISSETFEQDAEVLKDLKGKWNNIPESWKSSDDPCGEPWEGITCDGNHRVTQLILPSAELEGNLPDDIGNLTELTHLDLSFNPDLSGNISPRLGDLSKLYTLTLQSCGFSGIIPSEIGNAGQLSYISLSGNNLTGEIPSSIGKLSNLKWLDLAHNFLTGSIPISTSGSSGLDQLKTLQALILNNNQLSGSLPRELFSPEKVLSKLQIYGNQLTGEIPDTLYQVKTLEFLVLGGNSLSGSISSSINALTDLTYLCLEKNNFTGPLPSLTGMYSLSFVFLDNNNFDSSEAPSWFTSLRNLQVLCLQHSSLYGPIPKGIFSLPLLHSLHLKDNKFNGTLDMTSVTNPEFAFVNLEGNMISDFKSSPDFNKTVSLTGNPYCQESANKNLPVCQPLEV